MPSVQTFLSRGLTAREIRRMNECKMLPADAVTSQAFIKQLETKFLYHYGCELNEALTEICDSKAIDERPSCGEVQAHFSIIIFHLLIWGFS
jgi:hypothetical protein